MIARILEISDEVGQLIVMGVLIIIIAVVGEKVKRERYEKTQIAEMEIQKAKEARWTYELKIRELNRKMKLRKKNREELALLQSELDENFEHWQSNEEKN